MSTCRCSQGGASFGETRSLADAPGHHCEQGDDDDGLSVLIQACLFLWDCWMFSEGGAIIALSHDEHGVVYEPRSHVVPARRDALVNFGATID